MRKRRFLSILTVACLFCASVLSAQDLSNAILAKSDTSISSVAWNNNGKMFATTWNNSVILWDAESNTVLSVYSGHTGPIKKVRFSKDDHWLLTVGQDNTLILRDMEEQESASKITGSGFLPMRDAVFINNGYSIMTPLDGFNTTNCFRLMLTGQFVSKPVVQSTAPIYALDVNADGSLLLVGAQDGTVQIVDIATNQVVNSFPRYVLSQVPPVFTPDGRHFLSAADRTNLVIAPVGGNDALVIRDGDLPVNSALVSPDGTMVAAALKNGMIRVYDVYTGDIIYQFTMPFSPGDVVNALAFSPDGEFLLAGTEAGYILRWSITGKVFVPIKKSYEDKDLLAASLQYDENGRRRGNFEQLVASTKDMVPQQQLAIEAGFSTLTSDNYIGSVNLDVAYRNYQFYPFYWGFGAEAGLGFPVNNFTYKYYNASGNPISPPYIDSFVPYAVAGLSGFLPVPQLLLFAEFSLGPAFRIVSSNSFSFKASSKLYAGIAADFMTGVQWKFLRASVGVEYDSNYEFMMKTKVGGVIRFKDPKPKQAEAPDRSAELSPLGGYQDAPAASELESEPEQEVASDPAAD